MNPPISPEVLRQYDVPGPRYTSYPTAEREQMRELQAQVMVIVDDSGLQVTAQGWFFVRAVAMRFDRSPQADRNRARFSRII